MFSLELLHRGDSNEYTQYTIFNIKKTFTLYYPKFAEKGFSLGTRERVRKSRGKGVINARATEVLLYLGKPCLHLTSRPFYCLGLLSSLLFRFPI